MLRQIDIDDNNLFIGIEKDGKFYGAKLVLTKDRNVRNLYKFLLALIRTFKKIGVPITGDTIREVDGNTYGIKFDEPGYPHERYDE